MIETILAVAIIYGFYRYKKGPSDPVTTYDGPSDASRLANGYANGNRYPNTAEGSSASALTNAVVNNSATKQHGL